MNQATPALTSQSRWAWPVDLASYDRRAHLTADERNVLATLTAPVTFPAAWERRFGARLRRLLQPLDEVLLLTGASKMQRSGVIIILLREMHRLRTSFWAWSDHEWVGVLHPSAALFAQHHCKATTYRAHLLAAGYLLGGFHDFPAIGRFVPEWLAVRVFGRNRLDLLLEQIGQEMLRLGFGAQLIRVSLPTLLYEVLLLNQSPQLEDLSFEILTQLRPKLTRDALKSYMVSFSQALVHLGYLDRPFTVNAHGGNLDTLAGVPAEWLTFCQRWRATSTLVKQTRKGYYWCLVKTGRWLAQVHPEITSPHLWTRELAAEYVAAVLNLHRGDWTHRDPGPAEPERPPLLAGAKTQHLYALSIFFRDCQEWNWIPRRFDPRRSFAAPRSLRSLRGPKPRSIDDDTWAKLMWAGLNLTPQDLPVLANRLRAERWWYPFEMVRACTLVWLFTGLRCDEICRLAVGCIRWQHEDLVITGTEEVLPKESVCWLKVPVQKTGASFTKPVDRLVGEAIEAWERMRPVHRKEVDPKSGELVDYLFSFKGRRIAMTYLNHTVIPMLCQKAGVPQHDSLGPITSHRARSTIATQLFNAKDPMTLFELQEWLGHRYASSTQYYAKMKPTKLARAFTQAGYFERNLRVIEVLLDQDCVKSGAAAAGEPWRFYDLGHGYCSYDFFDQCPHRMACAKCAFYLPKQSSQAELLEGKAHLLRMLQEIPLTDEERAAVEEGVEALEKLSARLADVPTPAGPTPRQLEGLSGTMSFVALQSVQRLSSQGEG